jgi:4'-phosphopantetheinyl transferase
MAAVDLVLVDVSLDVGGDEKDCRFTSLVDEALTNCSTAEAFLASEEASACNLRRNCLDCFFGKGQAQRIESDEDVEERLKKSVSKYVKSEDRYLHLASLALKSQTFHLSQGTENDRPIIDLPRTEKGKPFIPGNNSLQFSVSHQFPFVGIARCRTKNDMMHVGMDIVVFESVNTNLYRTQEDFVSVFRSSFAESEWKIIQSAKNTVYEFYLRWAIKEAYTKAVGHGLSLEFSSFETRFNGIDDSLWDRVTSSDNGFSHHGEVLMLNRSRKESWHFFFRQLGSSSGRQGCVCICSGPLVKSKSQQVIPVPIISWTSIQDVMEWHANRVQI